MARGTLLYFDVYQILAKIKPPILFEVQNQVNHEFMNRVIGYSLSAYCRYKVYPIVLIFAIKSIEVEEEFVVANKKPFLEIESKFWAKKCFLLSSRILYWNMSKGLR
jgi:hypothetical protein